MAFGLPTAQIIMFLAHNVDRLRLLLLGWRQIQFRHRNADTGRQQDAVLFGRWWYSYLHLQTIEAFKRQLPPSSIPNCIWQRRFSLLSASGDRRQTITPLIYAHGINTDADWTWTGHRRGLAMDWTRTRTWTGHGHGLVTFWVDTARPLRVYSAATSRPQNPSLAKG